MRGSKNIITMIIIIGLILGAWAILTPGGLWGVLSYDCRLTGETLGRPWQWVNGSCYIQQNTGEWTRVDTNNNVSTRP